MAAISFSTPSDSLLRQPMTSIAQMKAATNPNTTQLQVVNNVYPSKGFAKQPTINSANLSQQADFYRNGSAIRRSLSLDNFSDDQKIASIRMYGRGAKGTKDQDLIPAYTKFILENVRESHVERSQIIETFGDFYVFFFGERPSVFNFSGMLINSNNANWVQDFIFFYENFLRGTKCVEQQARILLTYAGRQVEGFMLNVSHNTTAATEEGVPFSFDLVITTRRVVGVSLDFGLTLQNGSITQDKQFLDAVGQSGVAVPDVSAAYQKAAQVMNGQLPSSSVTLPSSLDAAAISKQFSLPVIGVGGGLSLNA